MTRRYSRLFVALLLPLALTAAFLSAATIRAGSPDICATCTYSTIQEALDDDATIGTTLVLGAETFLENVEITRPIILVGAGPGLTIIDGQMIGPVITINGGVTVSLSGVTLQNGDASSVDGGGVLNQGGIVSLSNSVVANNMAPNGAGIANDAAGQMTIDDVIVRDNVADELIDDISVCSDCAGGGILNFGVMTITNSTVHGNSALVGGGIENGSLATLIATNIEVYGNTAVNNTGNPDDGTGGGIENIGNFTLTNSIVRNNNGSLGAGIANAGTLHVSGSDIYENIADSRGGGLHNSFNLTVETSNVYGNQAGSGGGGGISSDAGTVEVSQTAVYSNSATGSGGGIVHNVDPSAGPNSFTLSNSTVSDNNTPGAGGGIRNAGAANTTLLNVTLANNEALAPASGRAIAVADGSLSLKNSIITTSQSGSNCSGTISSQGYNIASDSSCSLSGPSDLPNADPRIGALQNNGGDTLTRALLIASPAIDSGSGCPSVDQRGTARPFGPACDRGAYEFDQIIETVYLPFVIRP